MNGRDTPEWCEVIALLNERWPYTEPISKERSAILETYKRLKGGPNDLYVTDALREAIYMHHPGLRPSPIDAGIREYDEAMQAQEMMDG